MVASTAAVDGVAGIGPSADPDRHRDEGPVLSPYPGGHGGVLLESRLWLDVGDFIRTPC